MRAEGDRARVISEQQNVPAGVEAEMRTVLLHVTAVVFAEDMSPRAVEARDEEIGRSTRGQRRPAERHGVGKFSGDRDVSVAIDGERAEAIRISSLRDARAERVAEDRMVVVIELC